MEVLMNPERKRPNLVQRFFREQTVLALVLLTMAAGLLAGVVLAKQVALSDEGQQVAALQDYQPSEVTQVIASDGKAVLGEFSLERRIPLTWQQIPDRVKLAILAIEDSRFYSHVGVDPIGIGRALVRDFFAGQKVEGASTITQQLARILFLTPEKTWTRKIRETLIALEIERYYTKEQILTLYCNQIFLGGGAYGVEAAAQYYFGKPVNELSLEQMATVAGLPKAPNNYSPMLHPHAAMARRNLVLDNMISEGYITRAEGEAAKTKPLNLDRSPKITNNDKPAAYFLEEVRRELEAQFGTQMTHGEGLKVYTTLNAEMQTLALKSVRKGLHAYNRRHRVWRGNLYNVIASDGVKNLQSYKNPDWADPIEKGDFVTGIIMSFNGREASGKIADYHFTVTSKETSWTGKTPDQLFKPGDLAVFEIKDIDEKDKHLSVALDQIPAVQGALVALDVKTGEVRAMIGGYDFNTNKFNNATQANRQTGSSFKPFIYTTAMEQGLTPDDIILDAPFERGDWKPHNYDGRFAGAIPLRLAIAQSRNVPAVRLLDEVGINKAVQMVKRFGLPNPMAPFLPSALGATEEPLIDMVSAYSVFPNQGKRQIPHYIRSVKNRDGNTIYEWKPQVVNVVSSYVALQMVTMMRGVVDFGTAASLRAYPELAKRPFGGKTGTTNSFTDAWFIGYSPSMVCGVWIGYAGEKRTLGTGETGARAALPMWIDFMRPIVKNEPIEDFPKSSGPSSDMLALQAKKDKEHIEKLKAEGDVTIPPEQLVPSTPEVQPGKAVDYEAPPLVKGLIQKEPPAAGKPPASDKPPKKPKDNGKPDGP